MDISQIIALEFFKVLTSMGLGLALRSIFVKRAAKEKVPGYVSMIAIGLAFMLTSTWLTRWDSWYQTVFGIGGFLIFFGIMTFGYEQRIKKVREAYERQIAQMESKNDLT